MKVNVSVNGAKFEQCDVKSEEELRSLFPTHSIFVAGKPLGGDNQIFHDCHCIVTHRLPGGKGGFGSLLRAFGKQILISNNKEACRDLNGRRMRDVNNEKKLKEWLLTQAERKRAKEEEKRQRLERKRRASPKHYFSDLKYQKQKECIHREVDTAIEDAFRLRNKTETAKKTPSEAALRLIGIPEEIESDDENEEIICISQELYDRVMAEENATEQRCEDEKQTNGECIHEVPPPDKCESVIATKSTDVSAAETAPVSWPSVDLEALPSVQSCLDLGADRLKYELSRRGLKCGGTLSERAERLWSVRGLTAYPKRLLAKSSARRSVKLSERQDQLTVRSQTCP